MLEEASGSPWPFAMAEDMRGEALERFQRQTAIPVLVLSLAIIPLLVIPLIWDLSAGLETTFLELEWFI